ncbi:hypothetical protein JCM8115_000160 [Rhodotorula mucilaginosa]|uniref:MARVEL domain-containing protein n=1 Tax=Rhodotorula mucilaginosa TaxID=5537 RepID=A0A9P6W4N8_RHOMI|nr:hypothetical protein C6P46_001174 [Rhodotorula mucilaginosa]TKA58010.1 hypothetical protein B0A53_00412 [Rhodotorula sp. CCFEE 5036]
MNTFAGVRLGLWCWFYFCALLAWVLAAAFIGRTEDNFGLVFLSYARAKEWPFGSLIIEFTATFVVWALFLGGSAALSSKYSSWGWCFGSTCSLARSVEAWGWISWVTLTFLLIFIGIAGCIGPDKDDTTAATGTGPNREVVGATEMGVHQQAPVSTGPQGAYPTGPQSAYPAGPQTTYAGQPEPKGPAAPSAYATGNQQMQA